MPNEAAPALAAANAYQRAFLNRDPDAACDSLTGEAKRGLVEEFEVSVNCVDTFSTIFGLLGPEEDAELREAIREVDPGDLSVNETEATVPLPGDRELHLQRIEGRWYVSDTRTSW